MWIFYMQFETLEVGAGRLQPSCQGILFTRQPCAAIILIATRADVATLRMAIMSCGIVLGRPGRHATDSSQANQ